jgi:hypothetical protein
VALGDVIVAIDNSEALIQAQKILREINYW